MAKQTAVIESNPGSLGVIPASMREGDIVADDNVSLYQGTPYAMFLSSRAPSFAKFLAQIPDVQDSDPILVYPGSKPAVRLDPFRFYLVRAKTHYSTVDTNGNITDTTTDVDVARADKSYLEHVETVVLVALPAGLVPARCTFKTTKVGAVRSAMEEIESAKKPEWAKKSAEHAAALVVPDARYRFTTRVGLTARTARASGNKYVAATGVCKPTGVADWKQLAEFFAAKANHELCDATVAQWHDRLVTLGVE